MLERCVVCASMCKRKKSISLRWSEKKAIQWEIRYGRASCVGDFKLFTVEEKKKTHQTRMNELNGNEIFAVAGPPDCRGSDSLYIYLLGRERVVGLDGIQHIHHARWRIYRNIVNFLFDPELLLLSFALFFYFISLAAPPHRHHHLCRLSSLLALCAALLLAINRHFNSIHA